MMEVLDYYPFGLQMPGRTQNASNPNDDAKFTGYLLEQDGDLGVYHAEARMYDPVIGRFTSVDPILGEQSSIDLMKMEPRLLATTPYGYVFGDPVRLRDPDGRMPECPDCEKQKQEIITFEFHNPSNIRAEGIGAQGRFMTTGHITITQGEDGSAAEVNVMAIHAPNQLLEQGVQFGGSAGLIIDGEQTAMQPLLRTPTEGAIIFQTGSKQVSSTALSFPNSATNVQLRLEAAQSFITGHGAAMVFPPRHVNVIPIRGN